ncbi:sulfotransferase family protein [Sphingomonas quercus]|uniref:Sulfotransferase family protein n=1 Tax=Sphingomonas quercus TaxID=2842451 RepID=A0ABS6BFB9_9SPHN|nr:sulfotransferase family protein [Sphingomonas quercus]MBU3076994.1 sulfotransferase family protein [Sphingomonas quercus]
MGRAAILILGMHRSGTSALTWAVGRLGAALPADGIDPHADNARGYFESAGLVKADDQLLRVCRSSWFDPRPLDWSRLPPGGLNSRKERIAEAIAAAWGDAPLIAIKDPRQCRFVPVVAEVLAGMGIAARAVLMLRKPDEIAGSIARRDGTTSAYAHLLWLRHMIDAERATRGMMRAVVDYDALLVDWRGTLGRVAPLAGRPGWVPDAADAEAISAFLDPGLRHHRGEQTTALEEPLAGIVAAVSAGLDRLQLADDSAARATLDAAYARLDAVPWLEGDIVHDELRHRRMPTPVPVAPPASAPVAEPAPPPPPPAPDPEPDEAAELIRNSGLFDADWYRAAYPDVAASGLDPATHYLRIGAAEGRNPSPLFDTGFYARQMARRDAGRGEAA